MIHPIEADIGRKVVYRSHLEADPEEGVITSLPGAGRRLRETHVWVRFRGPLGELTRCDQLEWISP